LNAIISYVPWNNGLRFFEVDIQQGNSKILRLLPQVLVFGILEKMISVEEITSKIAKFGKKTQGIFGVKIK
jgi:hypothetical protein